MAILLKSMAITIAVIAAPAIVCVIMADMAAVLKAAGYQEKERH